MRILILDDDPSVRQSLALGLMNFGYQSVSCSTPQEAFDRIDEEEIDFVLSDYKMPEMTGLEFVSRVRRTSQIPVMIITGYANSIDRLKAKDLGVSLILDKPFSLSELGTALKKMSSFTPSDSSVNLALGAETIEQLTEELPQEWNQNNDETNPHGPSN